MVLRIGGTSDPRHADELPVTGPSVEVDAASRSVAPSLERTAGTHGWNARMGYTDAEMHTLPTQHANIRHEPVVCSLRRPLASILSGFNSLWLQFSLASILSGFDLPSAAASGRRTQVMWRSSVRGEGPGWVCTLRDPAGKGAGRLAGAAAP